MISIPPEPSRRVNLSIQVEGSGPPLVLIHGWAASQRFWQNQVSFFSKTYQVITYDLRGHGDSEKPRQGYSIADHVADLFQVIYSLKLKKPTLVGHSLGGMIAQQYVLDNPDTIKALVLVGTSPHPVPSRGRALQLSLFGWLIRFSRSRAAKLTKRQLFAPNPDPDLVKWVNEDSLRTPTRVVLACLKEVRRFNVLDQIQKISMPTALIRGEYDTVADEAMLEYLGQMMPNMQMIEIAGAGHNCMLEQPNIFNDTLLEFLQATAHI